MTPRALRVLLVPEDEDDQIIVSRKKTAKLVEELERTKNELEKVREESHRLREEKEALARKLKQLQTSLPVLGANGKTDAEVGIPSSKTYCPRPRPLPRRRERPVASSGIPG
jgi:hypothetical protein